MEYHTNNTTLTISPSNERHTRYSCYVDVMLWYSIAPANMQYCFPLNWSKIHIGKLSLSLIYGKIAEILLTIALVWPNFVVARSKQRVWMNKTTNKKSVWIAICFELNAYIRLEAYNTADNPSHTDWSNTKWKLAQNQQWKIKWTKNTTSTTTTPQQNSTIFFFEKKNWTIYYAPLYCMYLSMMQTNKRDIFIWFTTHVICVEIKSASESFTAIPSYSFNWSIYWSIHNWWHRL